MEGFLTGLYLEGLLVEVRHKAFMEMRLLYLRADQLAVNITAAFDFLSHDGLSSEDRP